MKALKTIVATVVIACALMTPVAMAGARHVDSRGDAATPAVGPAVTRTHHGGGADHDGGHHGGGTHHGGGHHDGGTHHGGGHHD